ncbi:O-methylsterigmatocystin oxidoreductase [Epithele typhae]|uniref:O-methylsterigmatocystin oxidoreductase n=1 Tax=Epithele typhae TaxID=378194 RepID=UPI002008A4FB|nr:O-methylsterigmatocystin oxidoreductase [Epithele typhae]KAH9911824.1 O-methylsterigmatocystin oxidoreductase [Epithele typhae]
MPAAHERRRQVSPISAIASYLRSVFSWRRRSRGRPFPPGPPGLPFIGNLLDMPMVRPWEGLRELCHKYGDILGMTIMGSPVVVLNSANDISQYLDGHSATTSSRPRSASQELLDLTGLFAFMPYGPEWRLHRRTMWQYFTPTAVTKYIPAIQTSSRITLHKLLEAPDRFEEHFQDSVGATLMKVVYGLDAKYENDESLMTIDKGLESGRESLVPGRFLVDVIPILRFLPPFFPSQKRFYDSASRRPACDRVARGVTAVTFAGPGSDTTCAVLKTFVLAMSLNPDVLKRAQAETDAAVGPTRLPDLADRDALPYVNAMYLETLRWMQVVPLGLAHNTTEDEQFGDYLACMHDPNTYHEPASFVPERFLRDGKLDPEVRNPTDFVFGFGRRICPGRHYAESDIFLTMAHIIHVFDIRPPVDEDGREVAIEPKMVNGFVSWPEDCRCRITPRTPHAAALIVDEFAQRINQG